ncbi:MAG TPA: hypothetical protein VMX15_04270 [Candidatus Heimdallarchaeota archaeon]|nr:hypothetical protein [Candidatus Heimdallarchaeota archaeon]
MKNAILLVIVWAAILALASGYVSLRREAEQQAFEFSSGGAYHIEGYGEWTVTVDTQGALFVTHNVRGDIVDYGPFLLAGQENLDLWKLIRAIEIESMESSDRLGIPEEVQYGFVLRDNGLTHSVSLWADDAREREGVVALVEQLAVLIEKVTGEQPVFY